MFDARWAGSESFEGSAGGGDPLTAGGRRVRCPLAKFLLAAVFSKKHQVLDPAPAAYRRQTSKEMLPDLREAARQTPTDLGMCEAERPRELKRKRMEVDKNRSLRRAGARDR